LANHFLAHYWERHRPAGDVQPKLTDACIEFLRSRPWRGNVRELQNVIEHVAVIAEPGQSIRPEDIPVYEDAVAHPPADAVSAAIMSDAYHSAKDKLVAHFEKEYLQRLVVRAGGNMSRAARLANIEPYHAVPVDGEARVPARRALGYARMIGGASPMPAETLGPDDAMSAAAGRPSGSAVPARRSRRWRAR